MGKITKILFCECGARTGRKINKYDDSYENVYEMYECGRFGTCNKCGGRLSPKKFWKVRYLNGAPLKIRFNNFVEKKNPDECWVWKGHRNIGGYGILVKDSVNMVASRVAWEIEYGEIPKGKVVCHKCDNPICVNHNHLFLGTQKENIHDSIEKGRFQKGINNGIAKLTIEQVKEIKYGNKTFETKTEEAEHYNISRAVIYNIRKNNTWKDV